MYYDRGMAHFAPGKDVPIMDVQTLLAQLPPEQPDIFLCTRELPDKLTAETAALRQLCSALAGDGYKVFFPAALPKELTDEQRAQRIVDAVKNAKVMVAAGVGREGLDDPMSRALWKAFLSRGEDAADRFILCWRDQGEDPLPSELGGREPLDMTDLRFLFELKEKLELLLPPESQTTREEPSEEPPEEKPAEASEEEPAAAAEEAEGPAPEEEAAPAEEAPPASGKKPFPWKWVLLGVAAAAVILWLVFFRK